MTVPPRDNPQSAPPTTEESHDSPVEALEHAQALQFAGKLAEAESLLQGLLADQPDNAPALHLLGVVAYQGGRPEEALDLFRRAVVLAPDDALSHSNLGELCRQQGLLKEAVEHGELAVALVPGMASAHLNLGLARFDAGDYAGARTSHEQALALAPGLAPSLNGLGCIARVQGDHDAALDWFRRAVAMVPQYAEALTNLGAMLVELNRPDEAVVPLGEALRLQPDSAAALCVLGLARNRQERRGEAQALLRRALEIRPDFPGALIGLALVLRESHAFGEAEQLLHRCVESAPDNGEAWSHLGTLYLEWDAPEQAEAAYARALALDRRQADALSGMAWLQVEAQETKAARELLSEALAVNPESISARVCLAQMDEIEPGDANLDALEALLPQSGGWPGNRRISLHYALGKCYDDLGEYDRAFHHFTAGARIKRARLDYDAGEDTAHMRRIAVRVNAEFIAPLSGAGDLSDLPIFVLGMPRSGTTLVEQIIASHPQVHGAGELYDLLQIVAPADTPAPPYPDNLAELTRERLTAWGTEYVARLRRRAPEAGRIIDKMPVNYLALGLIPAMLPNAKIIHVRRDPLDTCLSCFTRLFSGRQDATYDLAELGRHYAAYARLMQHWRDTLPAGSFLEVDYEAIVADLEGEARRLIDYCALPWDDSCLRFHETRRTVRTASIAQVRRPIYSSSIGRWHHYADHLGPLFDALGEFAPQT